MADFPGQAQLANLTLIESYYKMYLQDPASVDVSWRRFFEGVDFAGYLIQKEGEAAPSLDHSAVRIVRLIQAYRRYGHLQAHFNPLEAFAVPRDRGELSLERLGFSEKELKESFPTLGFCGEKEAPLAEIIEALKKVYCGPIGFEYMDLDQQELERWLQQRIEPELAINLTIEEKKCLLDALNRSEIFEMFLHTKYAGQKRFSLEGAETMIPIISAILEKGAELSMEEFFFGMPHRGRLNALANILGKPYSLLFQEFEDNLPAVFGLSGDVKYHKGFTAEITTSQGKKLRLYLAANSSCLESPDAIVLGMARARQIALQDEERKKVGAILIHGDAALAGQGIVYETLQFYRLPGYGTGGTIHIVVNNQIGYTTLPEEGRSTTYCTDIAKAFGAPVFHVNAEDPESCLFAASLSLEIRLRFQCDVFIDLNCYRKYGHNEGDEPSFTQPLQYAAIRSRKPIRELYVEQLMAQGVVEKEIAAKLEQEFHAMLSTALQQAKEGGHTHDIETSPTPGAIFVPVKTAVASNVLKQIVKDVSQIPAQFHLHPKLQKWAQARLAMIEQGNVDWALAETLAWGSLLIDGKSVRLTGQDVARGTFSQRHTVWWDQEQNSSFCPFTQIQGARGRFDVYNSTLSEYGALAFEYGYSAIDSETLVVWEAQYGDFVIGAEILIDHYLSAAEQKWGRANALTLLLPHGYEGSGPEHSSGRMERFLQLSANDNMQIVYPTTPAQYFHLLRRQALRTLRKPLIVFTPKSLLRSPLVMSPIVDFEQKEFEEILDDPAPPDSPKRLILCSGKIFYDILEERASLAPAVLIRIEQIYPLHLDKLKAILSRYSNVQEALWVQEEPENMGAWEYLQPELHKLLPKISYVGRPRSASTATGSMKTHLEEQKHILERLKP